MAENTTTSSVMYLIRRARVATADRVAVGTDYPFDMGEDDPAALLAGAALTLGRRRAISDRNAVRLLRRHAGRPSAGGAGTTSLGGLPLSPHRRTGFTLGRLPKVASLAVSEFMLSNRSGYL